jgi:predicted O-linked N-acetylglucosamine transferase (SPINDLY family)
MNALGRNEPIEGIDSSLLCEGRSKAFSDAIHPTFIGSGSRKDHRAQGSLIINLSLNETQLFEAFQAFAAQDYRTCLQNLGPFLEEEPYNLAAAMMLLTSVSRLGAPLADLLKQPTIRWALGNTRFVRRLLHEALDQKDQVLAFEILQRLGFEQGQDADALLCLSVALDVFEPDIVDQMLKALDQDQRGVDPFRSLLLFDDPPFHAYAAGRKLKEIVLRSGLEAPALLALRPRERIRIGYVSSDFRSHATSHLMWKLFDFHDRNQFEVMALSTFDSRFGWNFREVTEQNIDPMRAQLRQAAEHFIDLPESSHMRLEAVRDLQCDILIDLNGLTTGQSQDLFFKRAAPIQLAYLGYPGTTANPSIDGLITDRFLIPPEEETHYPERLVPLPGFYQINSYRHSLIEPVPDRSTLDLPDDATVFSCFCKTQKIARDLFAGWCFILKNVQNSVLWLVFENERQVHNMREFAKAYGISPDRLIFAPVVSPSEHVARCGAADIMLDTFPYGGHTTATDSVWSGVPCLTLQGRSFQGRVAFSLNCNLELDLFNCRTFEDYIARAITYGNDRSFLKGVKQDLLFRRMTHPVFDTELRTRELEAVFSSFVPRSITT